MLDIKCYLDKSELKRVLFMGTPDFASAHLEGLIEAGENIEAVFTQPDRPKGRGHKLTPPPVKVVAMENGIPVHQPDSKDAVENMVKEINPDIIIVVAYGMFLSSYIVNNYLCLNVHASLLPKYRGASPIQSSILAGDKVTGVSIMVMDEKMDTGPVIKKSFIDIDPQQNAGDLFNKMAEDGPSVLVETLSVLRTVRSKISIEYQDDSKATYCKKLTKADGKLDLSMPPQQVICRINGLNPWPGTSVEVEGKVVKIIDARLDENGALELLEVQPAGKKRMAYNDYLRGYPPIL